MHNDRMDQLLEDICQNDWHRIEGLKDIQIPEYEKSMGELKMHLQKEKEVSSGKHTTFNVLRNLSKITAVAACILVCAIIFSIISDMPPVKAFKFNIIRTFFEFKEGTTIIKQGNFDPNSVPKGKLPPPPPEFDSNSMTDGLIGANPPANSGTRPIEKTLTLEQAKKETPFALLVPGYLPEGYKLKEVRSKQSSLEHYIIEQEYTNSDNGYITIRQHSGIKSFGMGGGTPLKVKSIKVMGEDAVLITNETSYCSTTWYKDEFRYEIMADTSEKEFVKLLDSLRFFK